MNPCRHAITLLPLLWLRRLSACRGIRAWRDVAPYRRRRKERRKATMKLRRHFAQQSLMNKRQERGLAISHAVSRNPPLQMVVRTKRLLGIVFRLIDMLRCSTYYLCKSANLATESLYSNSTRRYCLSTPIFQLTKAATCAYLIFLPRRCKRKIKCCYAA